MISKTGRGDGNPRSRLRRGIAKGEAKGEAKGGEAKGIAKGETLVHDRVAKLKVAMDEAGRREKSCSMLWATREEKTESLMREFGIQ